MKLRKKAKSIPTQLVPLHLEENDILLVKLGIADMGNGSPPWIPTEDDLKYTKETFDEVVPKGVQVIVHHFGIDLQVIETNPPLIEFRPTLDFSNMGVQKEHTDGSQLLRETNGS